MSILFLVACGSKKNTELKVTVDTNVVKTDSVKPPVNNDSMLLDYSGNVLKAIKDNDGEKIAGYIHPQLGVRFSPYTYVDTTNDIKMSVDQFKDQWNKNAKKKMVWGLFDGSGEKINMTIADYFKRFVYDLDFLELGEASYNQSKGSGNVINNIKEIYPKNNYVEYYVAGVDKKFEGMDWRSLTLVFQEYQENFYLIGIVHNEWTI